MKPSKMIAVAVLSSLVLQLLGCSTTKLLRPGTKPGKFKSKEITVVTTDQRALHFTEIRVYDDTLYGVNGIRFPDDRHSPDISSVPFSEVESISYRTSKGWIEFAVLGVAVLAVIVALAFESWGPPGY